METKSLMTESAAVFDVCDTLYYSNTTHDFIRFVAKEAAGPARRSAFKMLDHQLSPLRYLLVGVGLITGRDVFKMLSVAILKGMKDEEVRRVAERFVDEFLEMRKVPQTHKLIEQSARDGLRIVLCSSSIEPVVAAVAKRLGVRDFVCATLETESGRYTGRIQEDPTGKKLSVLRRISNLKIDCAVSDNLSDLELLSAARRGIAVTHNERKRRFWAGRNFEVIDLDL